MRSCTSVFHSLRGFAEVKSYKKEYSPDYAVIHSTVPVGTSRECSAIHSPVRGRHPDLSEGIETFVKFVGGEKADPVAEYFMRAGMKVQLCRKPETTELAKILSTSYYALCIEYVKEAERLCQKENVPFGEAFTLFQKTYNEGYKKLGDSEFQRPNLQPLQKKQGGHCTVPNLEFLDSDFADFIIQQNKKF